MNLNKDPCCFTFCYKKITTYMQNTDYNNKYNQFES